MSKYLIETKEIHRADSPAEAEEMITKAKNDPNFTLVKYTSEYKETKFKSEVVDTYYKVTFLKQFTNIKDPDVQIDVKYSNGGEG